jgi:glycosyltransferase involved in cell wall biosynthesis
LKTVLREKPDGVISYSFSSSILLCIVRLFVKFKLIVSERNTSVSYTLRDKIRFNFYRFSDAVVPNSKSQFSYINQHAAFLTKKTQIITNFVDCEEFRPRNIESTDLKTNTFIGVGRIVPQKNIIKLIKALGILKRKNILIKIDWYGNANKEYYDLCLKQIKEEEVEDYFAFKKVDKNIKETYGKYEALCLPSIYEGFPNVICEAMSCGLPIICSNVCDNGAIVENGKNGLLFDPDNLNSICDSLSQFVLMSDEEKREISKRNREKALILFSKDVFIKKYIEIIEK